MIKFTKEEKAVLIFLLAALFAGSAVMYYKKISPAFSAETFEFKESKKKYSEKININKATKQKLTGIRGVGPVLAGRIISYREKNGYFRRAEEIKNIKGIGPKTYEKIKKQIALE